MQRSKLVAVLACIPLVGCATTKLNYQPRSTQISFPEIGVRQHASLGDRMVAQGTSTIMKGILLNEPDNIHNFKFSAGFYPQVGEDSDFTYHSYQTGQSYNGMGTLESSRGLLGISMQRPDSIKASKKERKICLVLMLKGTCDTEHSYTRTERPVVTANNFQQILIYNGRTGSQIKVAYREFSGDMARPAFSNEVQYDLSQSAEITYKGAKIKVLDAGNDGIDYIVERNFNTQ